MNIFLTNTDPIKAAQDLDDIRLNKMILETAQILCSAYRRLFLADGQSAPDNFYKDTHINHPCTKWARASIPNYRWLIVYFDALNAERQFRTSKQHLSYTKLYSILRQPLDKQLTNAMQETIFDFDCSNQVGPSVTENYKACLRNKWLADKRLPKWTQRGQPSWR